MPLTPARCVVSFTIGFGSEHNVDLLMDLAKLGEGGNGTVCVGQVCLPDKTCDFAVKLLAATGSKDAKSTLRVALHALPFLFGRQLATGTPGPFPSVRSSLRECVLNLTRWNACFPHSPQGTFETSC